MKRLSITLCHIFANGEDVVYPANGEEDMEHLLVQLFVESAVPENRIVVSGKSSAKNQIKNQLRQHSENNWVVKNVNRKNTINFTQKNLKTLAEKPLKNSHTNSSVALIFFKT